METTMVRECLRKEEVTIKWLSNPILDWGKKKASNRSCSKSLLSYTVNLFIKEWVKFTPWKWLTGESRSVVRNFGRSWRALKKGRKEAHSTTGKSFSINYLKKLDITDKLIRGRLHSTCTAALEVVL